MLFIIFLAGTLAICQAQEPEKEDRHGSWQVNKEFDKNGNLIRYDSVYRYTSEEASEGYTREMIDSLFRDIPKWLEPVGRDMEAFFKNDPFFSQIFGADSLHPENSTPYRMEDIEDYLRRNSLWIEQADMDELADEMERLRQEFLRQMRREPKVPESETDSLRKF